MTSSELRPLPSRVNSNRLAYSGQIPTPPQQAADARRWGWLHYTEHYLMTMRAYGGPLLLNSVGTPLLYLLAMGVGLGELVRGGVDGVSYLTFVGPGVMASTVMMAASTESTYPVMEGFKWRRIYYGAVATPITPAQIGIGHFVGGCVRYVGQALIFWWALLLFGATHSVASALTVPISVLGAMAFAAPLQAFSATLKDEGAAFNFINRFVVMPMTLFAGTFFPLSAMPVYLRWIGWISPWWHTTQLNRIASYGMREPAWLTATHLAYLLVLVGVGLLLVRRNYTKRLGQ